MPGTTSIRQTTGSKPRSRAVRVVAPVSRTARVPVLGSNPARDESPTSQTTRASGMGLESAASATALNFRDARSGSCSGSAVGLGVTTSVCGSRCTTRLVRRSWPKPAAAISVLPGPRASTMPVGPTTATLVSADRHCTPPVTSRLFCAGTRTRSVSASSGPSISIPPLSAISAGSTSTGTVAMRPVPVEAWTMLFPGATPSTMPPLSTVATSGLSDFQRTRATASGLPSSRSACGVIWTLSPGSSMAAVGSSVRALPTAAPADGPEVPPVMSTASDARFPWIRASILARPGATPCTVPSCETRTMAVSELQNRNLAEAIRLPCRS